MKKYSDIIVEIYNEMNSLVITNKIYGNMKQISDDYSLYRSRYNDVMTLFKKDDSIISFGCYDKGGSCVIEAGSFISTTYRTDKNTMYYNNGSISIEMDFLEKETEFQYSTVYPDNVLKHMTMLTDLRNLGFKTSFCSLSELDSLIPALEVLHEFNGK